MQSVAQTASVPKKTPWAGYILSGLPGLFLLFDAVLKFIKPPEVVEGTTQLGYSESVILPLGIVLLVCTVVYLIPRTSVLGAVLLTGYLGGAVATHVRTGNPLFSHTLFPTYIGALIWAGLFLRDDRLRELIPLRITQSDDQTASVSNKKLWAGRVISALPALMLVFSGVMKLVKPAEVVQEFSRLGYAESSALGIGVIELVCAILYVIPRTSILGAILLTGYLGGAVATHVRIGDVFIFPIIFGALVWAGLYLRDGRLRELIPLRS